MRITGGDLDRLSIAARPAADAGLKVWFSPHPCQTRRTDPRLDLDLASYGVVAILEPDSGRATGAQVPKEAFAALAGHPLPDPASAGP